MNCDCTELVILKLVLKRAALLAAFASLTIAGCGKAASKIATHPARGTVTFKGQPTPGAFVTLHPKTPVESVPAPRANVGKDGRFQVTTFNGGDGAPEGEYIVTIQWFKPIKNGNDIVAGPNVIPPKYSKPQTSDVAVHIAAGENELKPIKL